MLTACVYCAPRLCASASSLPLIYRPIIGKTLWRPSARMYTQRRFRNSVCVSMSVCVSCSNICYLLFLFLRNKNTLNIVHNIMCRRLLYYGTVHSMVLRCKYRVNISKDLPEQVISPSACRFKNVCVNIVRVR